MIEFNENELIALGQFYQDDLLKILSDYHDPDRAYGWWKIKLKSNEYEVHGYINEYDKLVEILIKQRKT